MLAELDQRLPDYSRIGEPRRDGDESCAIWYRHELMNVVEWGQFWLSETPDIRESVSWGSSFPRICTWALFCWSKQPTRRIRVYNTHLDHVSREARQNGAELILDRVFDARLRAPDPVIVMGDFNEEPSGTAIARFRNKLVWASREERGTTFHDFTGRLEGRPIDYIFCTEELQPEELMIFRDKVFDKWPSDHYPVKVQLKMRT